MKTDGLGHSAVKQCSGLRESVRGGNANKKVFMFHDSTSVLPPVIRHAVHPAVSVWREITLALSKHGGAWLSDVGISGFGVKVMQALHYLRQPVSQSVPA